MQKIGLISYVLMIIFFIFLLTACNQQQSFTRAEAQTATIENSSTPAPTRTFIPTSTPTPTPTVSFPVRNETPIPSIEFQEINSQNSVNLTEIARYGYPTMFSWQLLDHVDEMAILLSDKVQFISLTNKEVKQQIDLDVRSGLQWNTREKVNFSASVDAKYVAGITDSGVVEVWSRNNKKAYEYTPDESKKYGLAVGLSSDGSLLAVSSCEREYDTYRGGYSCTTEIVDWSTGAKIKRVRGLNPVFTPDGRYLIIEFDKKIQFYSTVDWKVVRYFGEPLNWSITFTPDGTSFALVDGNVFQVFRLEDFILLRYLDEGDNIDDLLFSKDGKRAWVTFRDKGGRASYVFYDLETALVLDNKPPQYISDCSWMTAEDKIESCEVPNSYEFITSELFPEQENKEDEFEIKETSDPNRFDLVSKGSTVATFNGLSQNWVAAHSGDYVIIESGIGAPGQALTQIIDLKTGKRIAKWNKGLGDIQESVDWLVFNLVILNDYSIYPDEISLVVFDKVNKKVTFEKQAIDDPLILADKKGTVGYIDSSNCLRFLSLEVGTTQEKICLPIQDNEYVRDARIFPNQEKILVATSKGKAYLVEPGSENDVTTLYFNGVPIDEIWISTDGMLIGTFSWQGDGYTRIWGVLPTEQ